MNYNIFISYSTKDLKTVKKFQSILNNTPDLHVFVAEDSVKVGERLGTRIQNAIGNSNLFLLLWSKNSKESEWVSQEIGIAKQADKDILPVLLDNDLTVPGFISDLKYISAHENLEQTVKDIQQEIQKRAEKFKKINGLTLVGLAAALIYLFSSE